jgi:hypothetical protein
MRRPRVKDCGVREPAPAGLILPGASGKLRRTAPSPRLAEPRGGQGVDAPDFAALPGGEEVLWITSDHDRNCQQSRGPGLGGCGAKLSLPLLPLGVRRTGRDRWLDPGQMPEGQMRGSPSARSALRATPHPRLCAPPSPQGEKREPAAAPRVPSPRKRGEDAGRQMRGKSQFNNLAPAAKPTHDVILGLVPRIWCPRHNPLTSHPY